MPPIYWKEIGRTIKASLGRFIAIVIIVAMGCGFFAGLRMTGVGMRKSADAFYDGTHLFDIQLVSTLGFSDETVDEIAATPGVEAVMPQRTVDVMADIDGTSHSVRIMSFDEEAAKDSQVDGPAVLSENGEYLDRLMLMEGRWPTADNECVVLYKKAIAGAMPRTIKVLYGSADLDGVLKVREYQVVGMVECAAFTNETTLSTTSLGSGMLGQVAFVGPSAFDSDTPYTQVSVEASGAKDALWGTDAYQQRVDEAAASIDSRLAGIANGRLAQVRDEAQKTLDDSRATYERERADAQAQLDDAKAQLEDAKAQLDSGQASLDEGRATLAEKRQQLADGRAQWEEGSAELADKEAELENGRVELEQAQATLDVNSATLQEAGRQLREAQAQLEAQASAIDEAKQQISAYEQGCQALVSAAQAQGLKGATVAEIQQEAAALIGQLEAAAAAGQPISQEMLAGLKALEAQANTLLDNESAIQQAKDGVVRYEEGLAALKVQEGQLDEGARRLEAGRSQLDVHRTQLEKGAAQIAAAKEQLAATKAQLDDGERQIQEGQQSLDESAARLEQGKEDYESGLAEYKENEAKAQQEFADAEAKLADGQAEIDDIARPDIYLLDRTRNYGAESYKSDSQRIDAIATAFPFFFFLVAALVSLTTMTRMVDDERGLIGTYKALGYSAGAICAKYLVYAGLASVVGALLGILTMSQLLPGVIFDAYGIIYAVPARPWPLPIEAPQALAAAFLGIAVTLGATLFACLSSLRESPASLMQPRAPKAGKRILLERVKPLWNRLSFSWKVTFRNIFRYKRRFFMTVVGIAGCTMLLLTGFGVRDSINDIIDKQFGEIMHYNLTVGLAEDATPEEHEAVATYLASHTSAAATQSAYTENVMADSAASDGKNHTATLTVPEDASGFSSVMTLRDRVTKEPCELADDACIVTEKLAASLGIAPGDTLELYQEDAVGNRTGSPHKITVTGVCETYLGSVVYLGKGAYEKAFGPLPEAHTVYGMVPESGPERQEIIEAVEAMGGVETVTLNDETIASYRSMLKSVDSVMTVLIAAAALLAFVVLYNLANINIAERVREIASLKVLGFTPKEVDAYVFREIVLIVIIGALVGLVMGVWFESYVIVTAEVDAAMFGREIHAVSFVMAFGLTLGFCGLVLLAMLPKLASIDMVESLKSVE